MPCNNNIERLPGDIYYLFNRHTRAKFFKLEQSLVNVFFTFSLYIKIIFFFVLSNINVY